MQTKVVEQGRERGVDRFNECMKSLHIGFRIRKVAENAVRSGASQTMWKRVKLSCNIAMLVVAMSSHVLAAAWESNPPTAHAVVDVHRNLEGVWKAWGKVVYAMAEVKPALHQILGFRTMVSTLLVTLQRTLPDTVWSGYYFHTLLHAADYMETH